MQITLIKASVEDMPVIVHSGYHDANGPYA